MTTGPLASLLLGDGAAARPVALSKGQVIRLQRFRADVAAAAARLAAIGCSRGLVACDDAYWATVGWFALAHNGAETVFPSNTLPATLAAMSGAFDHIVTDGAVTGSERTLMLAHEDGVSSLPPMDAEKACVTLFTSGSTGAPKRVAKTVRQLELEAATVDRLLGEAVPAAAWVHGTVVHNHLYGLTFRLCWPLATRRAFVGNPHQFWEPLLASMDRGSTLVTSPSHLSRLGGLPALPAERRPSAVLSGGAPLPESAAQATRELLGCSVREFYGSTEAGVVASRLRDGDEQPPWRALPGVSVKRLDDGRLQVRSPYLGDIENGETGDLIELDGDGGFRLLGRADRIAKIEGIRISLTDCETRLARLEGVAQAAVVVLGGATSYLAGVVVLDSIGEQQLASSGAFRLGRRLRRDLAATLPSSVLPRRWRFVPRLPTGPLGKVSASELAALFDTPELGLPEVMNTSPKVEPRVLACRQTAEGVELDLRIDADLAPLAGHFPNLPIVPGVCLIDWVVRLSAQHLGLLADGAAKIQTKFRRVLQPEADVTLVLRRLSGGRVQFEYRHLDFVYASGTIAGSGA